MTKQDTFSNLEARIEGVRNGFRATILANGKVLATERFDVGSRVGRGWSEAAVDAAYAKAKAWLKKYGLE